MAPTPRATRDLADKVLLALFHLLTLHLIKPRVVLFFQIDIYLVNLVLIVRKYIYFRLNKYYYLI
jgi:hypothetical protein